MFFKDTRLIKLGELYGCRRRSDLQILLDNLLTRHIVTANHLIYWNLFHSEEKGPRTFILYKRTEKGRYPKYTIVFKYEKPLKVPFTITKEIKCKSNQ